MPATDAKPGRSIRFAYARVCPGNDVRLLKGLGENLSQLPSDWQFMLDPTTHV